MAGKLILYTSDEQVLKEIESSELPCFGQCCVSSSLCVCIKPDRPSCNDCLATELINTNRCVALSYEIYTFVK